MLQKTENYLLDYCFGVLSLLLGFIEKTHGALAIGVPLLTTVAVQLFLPRWVSVAVAALVWIPAAVGMGIFLVSCWAHTSRG